VRKLVTQVIRVPASVIREAHSWTNRMPDLAWVTRRLINARVSFGVQLPLPLVYGGYSP
jgi:hypothetical protein